MRGLSVIRTSGRPRVGGLGLKPEKTPELLGQGRIHGGEDADGGAVVLARVEWYSPSRLQQMKSLEAIPEWIQRVTEASRSSCVSSKVLVSSAASMNTVALAKRAPAKPSGHGRRFFPELLTAAPG